MKRILFLLVAGIFACNTISAQAIETGDQAVNLGLGIGGTLTHGDASPGINLSYEMLPFDQLGIGYIGVGGYVSYIYSNDQIGPARYEYNYYVFGARGTYHFDFWHLTHDKIFNQLDLYAGVFAGFVYDNEDWNNNQANTEDYILTFRNDFFAGARFNFSSNFGVFSEIGYGLNTFTFGVDFLF